MKTDRTKQLTELRDALRINRAELDVDALGRFMGFYVEDSFLKGMLDNPEVVRALLYCLRNKNVKRQELVDRLFEYFTIKGRDRRQSSALISMLLFLSGVDFQLNKIEIPKETQEKDVLSDVMPNSSMPMRSVPVRSVPVSAGKPNKNRRIAGFIGALILVLIGALLVWLFLKNPGIVPEGRLVGTVVSTEGKTIDLYERKIDDVYSIRAFSKKKNGKYAEEEVFKTPKGKSSYINSVKFNKWLSSAPEGCFFAFNENDNSLYVPRINNDLTGADRYIVYQYDGQSFVCTSTNSAGFWLYPGLAVFDQLFVIGRTLVHLVRIDRMANGDYRYACWKSESNLNEKPDIVLFNDGQLREGTLCFFNGSYKYVIDLDKHNLWVYKDDSVLSCRNVEFLVK